MYSSIDCVTFIKSFTPEKRTRNVFQHCLRAFLLRAYHFFLWSACISTVFQHFLRAFPLLREAKNPWFLSLCISIGCTVRLQVYCVPVLFYVHIPTVFQHLTACISTMFKNFPYAFVLVPALFSVRIPTVLQHCMRALLLYSSSLCVHFYAFSALFSVRIPTVLQHCMRALLLYSSSFCVHFYALSALFSVRTSTVFQHCVRAFLLICSTLCMHFHLFCMWLYVLYWMCLFVFVCVCMKETFVCVCSSTSCVY